MSGVTAAVPAVARTGVLPAATEPVYTAAVESRAAAERIETA